MTVTLSVVGYGDPVSMPDLPNFTRDYWVLYTCILSGFMAYQNANASFSNLIKRISNSVETVTNEKVKQDLAERVEQFFLIQNHTFPLSQERLNEWKQALKFMYDF